VGDLRTSRKDKLFTVLLFMYAPLSICVEPRGSGFSSDRAPLGAC